MIKLGYKLMSEEHGPAALVRNAVRAEQAGFEFAAISDHFSPWLVEQGHSPFAWTVLGAAANATRNLGLMTAVTCPIMRYHPAVVAQAAATMAVLSGNRFALGLGSGERLNEHVVGEGWLGIVERQARLAEAVDIIKRLLSGELLNFRGAYFAAEHAQLFDRPDRPLPIVMAAGGTAAARLAGQKRASLIATVPKADLIATYRAAGGAGACYAEVALCYAPSEEQARATAHRYYRWSLTGSPTTAEMPHAEGFAAASRLVTPENVAEQVSCGPSADRHLRAIEKYLEAGYDHLILMQIGPEQEAFCDFFTRELAPHLRQRHREAA